MSGLELTNDETGQLLEVLLHQAFLNNYMLYERKLAGFKKSDRDLRVVIGRAAVDLFLAHVKGTPLADKIARGRDRYVQLVIEMRGGLHEPLRLAGSDLPRPPFRGPINSVWIPERALSMACVGPTSGELGAFVAEARGRYMPEAALLSLADTTWSELADRTVVVYGATSAPLVASLLKRADIKIDANGMTVNQRAFEGSNLVLIACQPHPAATDQGVLLYTAHDEANIVGVNNVYHGPTDWVVARRISKATFEPIARGVFAKPLSGEWMKPEQTS